jgi:hypothetical protein
LGVRDRGQALASASRDSDFVSLQRRLRSA